MTWRHGILLGDPAYFRVKSGRNFYTRNRWGFKKRVDRARAVWQWQEFKSTLESLGARVFVMPPERENPGAVFPANAGFLYPKYTPLEFSEKRFYLSNLTPHRAEEQSAYRTLFESFGCAIGTLPYQFEGEADFFPCGDDYIFTYGEIQPMGFRPCRGWPPYRFQFSHRSDLRNLEALRSIVAGHQVLEVRLIDTRYYHGDTALFAFGKDREYLLAYLEAMDQESAERLRKHLGSRLIPLSREDTENFTANSFQLDTAEGHHLILPQGVSEMLKSTLSALGFAHTTVDVSEFFVKGGGSIKCLLCDLGHLPVRST